MKQPIHKQIRLDFMCDNLFLVAANTLDECVSTLIEAYPRFEGLEYSGEDHEACTLYIPGNGCVLFMSYKHVEGYIICHEVGHITNKLFEIAGIPLTDSTDEVYCYHNSMLFKYVAEFFKENKVKIKM